MRSHTNAMIRRANRMLARRDLTDAEKVARVKAQLWLMLRRRLAAAEHRGVPGYRGTRIDLDFDALMLRRDERTDPR